MVAPIVIQAEGHIAKRAATGDLQPAKLKTSKNGVTVTRTLPFLSGSTITAAQSALGINAADQRIEGAGANDAGELGAPDLGDSQGSFGCSKRDTQGNVRVNQDCTFRRQAEVDIVYNPADLNNLLAGQDDSRVGFNQCGIDYSFDNGKHWGDLLPPFRQKLNSPEDEEPTASDPNRHTIKGGPGTLHTYDADSDPALAADSQGRVFFSCVAFDVASDASLLWVGQSPKGAEGSFYFNLNSFSRSWIVAEDNSGEVFHDKEFIAADAYKGSPNRDNVYVTWTVFNFNTTCVSSDNPSGFCSSPIFGSMTTDGGRHWSTPEEIAGVSPTLCFFGDSFDPTQNPNACNFDQGSDPVVLPNGNLEVVFNNLNTPAGNPNAQQLAVQCQPTGSSPAGTARLNCGSPVKVSDDIIIGEPLCDFGRGPEECVPGAFIRTNDFPRILKQNTQGPNLYVVWQDYRNGEYDIQMAMSTDGGLHWAEKGTVNPDTGLDHYFPAVEQSPSQADRLGVSYYRTKRVPGETTTPLGGFAPGMPGVQASDSDYVLAGGSGATLPYNFNVLSPVFAPPDGVQAGFNGDYSGLAINQGEKAHPSWSDTRNADPYAPANGVIHDEDVFTDNVILPSGKGKTGPGTIGTK